MENVIREFIEGLEKVAALGSQVTTLEAEVAGREVEALTLIFEQIKPVMPYISVYITKNAYHSGHQFHEWKYGYLEEKGTVLVDNFTREYTDKDTRGDYSGSQLILTNSGEFLKLTRQGEWSRWQGESSHWGTTERELTLEEVVVSYSFKEIVGGLVEAFKEAVQKNEKRQQEFSERLIALNEVEKVLAK